MCINLSLSGFSEAKFSSFYTNSRNQALTFIGTQMSDFLTPAAMTLDVFCSQFSIGKTTAYKLIKQKKLKVVKLGRRTLVPTAEAERLLTFLMEAA